MNRNSPFPTGRVLVVDDHDAARESMTEILRQAGHEVFPASSAIDALRRLEDLEVDVILTDLNMPAMSGVEFIRAVSERGCDVQIAMITAYASVASAVDAMRYGAFDYIEKPFDAEQLEALVERALRNAGSKTWPPESDPAHIGMIGSSSAMAQLRSQIRKVGQTDETVLISGESGTGKELVARSIHAASRRSHQSLISLNCPALSPQLMESELFGHERGAFTNAETARVGRFELADHGTILLDEVTEIELGLQAKLLRVLQEQTFERVGSSTTRQVDVRVLASTNRELRREVEQGQFREDLYFRLAVVPLVVPPLRDRRDDIPELAEHFLQLAAERLERAPCQLTPDAVQLLLDYAWPGNVRELENQITRASVLSDQEQLTADELRQGLMAPELLSRRVPTTPSQTTEVEVGMSLQEMERKLIESTLSHYDGHRQKTARALGIGVRTLANKLRSYGYGPRSKPVAV